MRPYGALSRACLVLGGVVAAGCSAPVAGDAADANGAVTQGMVLVERSISFGRDPADGLVPLTNVSAKFMRLSAAADPLQAERVIGSPFELPLPGSCMAVAPATADDTAAILGSIGSIELLDVGDVTIKTGLSEMPLAARAFPDVGDLVFGVFYTSRDAESDLPAPARYVFESSGSGLLDRFAFEADAPAGPEDVRIGDLDLGSGIDLTEGANAEVEWRPADGPSAPSAQFPERSTRSDDQVYVDVTSALGATVRCAFMDTGRGVIPGSFLQSGTLGPLPTSATVSLHRVRQVPFSTPGVDLGEVRFDLSVIGRANITQR